MTRRTWLEVDLNAVAANLQAVRALLRPNVKLAAVIKANAYGLGAVEMARVMLDGGADLLAVACLSEAMELRYQYPQAPLWVMGVVSDDDISTAVEARIQFTVCRFAQAELASEAALDHGQHSHIAVKLDTGFHRLGFPATLQSAELVQQITHLRGVVVDTLFAHLSLRDSQQDLQQVELFRQMVQWLQELGVKLPTLSICDSIGMVRYPDHQMDMVRAGAILYGAPPSEHRPVELGLKLPVRLITTVSHILDVPAGESIGYDSQFVTQRPTRITTLAVGYADGYSRRLANKAWVSVRGQRAPVVGSVCMDQCTIDVTDTAGVVIGDEVLLLSEVDEPGVSLMELAEWGDTNRNEVLCTIGPRVPRIYIEG
ncbi:MAG: alanine racemase [Armatimonadota bacterium]